MDTSAKGMEESLSLNNSIILLARMTLQVHYSVQISIKIKSPLNLKKISQDCSK